MKKTIVIPLLIAILIISCILPTELLPTPSALPPISTSLVPTDTPIDPQQVVLARAGEVVLALKNQDMLALVGNVHPDAGLRLSPYAYVQETDLVFPFGQIARLPGDTTIYHWGLYDGSGFDINLTYSDYYKEFIYDVDFASAPQISINQRVGLGNTMDNSLTFYPGAIIVEYHFPGFDPSYQGMDWRSLRLVFKEYLGEWYLIGIIHDEWTI